MLINPHTLKTLRNERELSQDVLAQISRISKRTIARHESGNVPKDVRKHTVERIADALKVKPEVLGRARSEIGDDELEEWGYTSLKVLLTEEVRLNYRWVAYHYGVDVMDLIDAAPWMFTLLAEMSLKERRHRLEEYEMAFDEVERLCLITSVTERGNTASNYAVGDEKNSLAKRDVFGKVVLDTELVGGDPFDPEETNPFIAFVEELAERTGTDAIRIKELDKSFGSDMPHWPVFQQWLDELTGGDSWAHFAVENVKIGLSDMPEELKHSDKTAERIEWLVAKIPPEVREREERRRAEWDAKFGKITFKELGL